MGTKVFDNALDLITFTRASGGTALRKISYGPELVTNGGFDSDTGWSKGAGTIISDGVATSTSVTAGTTTVLQNVVGFSVGSVYEISVDVISITGVLRLIALGNVLTSQTISSAGSYTFTVAASTAQVYLQSYGATTTCVVDNISVKEVLFDRPDGTLTLFNHPTNVPRIEYDTSGAVKGLLVEEARTNVLLNSNDFSQASWGKTALTVSACPDASPSGITDAQTLTNSGGTGLLTAVFSGTAGVTYSFSVWMKRRTGTGTIFMVDVNGVNIEQTVTSEWKRFVVTSTASTVTVRAYIRAVTSGDAIDVYGAQLEAGAFPTSYIPTAGATATRAADIASIPVSAFGYNQQAGSVVVECLSNSGEFGERAVSFSDGTSTNQNWLQISGSGTFVGNVYTSGSYVAQLDNTTSTANGFTAALAFKDNSFGLSVNGSSALTDPSGSIAVYSDLHIGRRHDGLASTVFNGHIRSISYYPRRLSNAQLQELTT